MSLIRDKGGDPSVRPGTRRSTGMTISRLSLRALAIILALAPWPAPRCCLPVRSPIDSAVLGADWECTQTAYRADDLRAAGHPGS